MTALRSRSASATAGKDATTPALAAGRSVAPLPVAWASRAGARSAELQIPCVAHGWGTYLQVTVNGKWSTCLVGSVQAEFARQPDLTKAACLGVFTVEFDPACLVEGEGKLDVRAIPVAGLARVASELLLLNTKLALKLVDGSGQPQSESKVEQVLYPIGPGALPTAFPSALQHFHLEDGMPELRGPPAAVGARKPALAGAPGHRNRSVSH